MTGIPRKRRWGLEERRVSLEKVPFAPKIEKASTVMRFARLSSLRRKCL